MKITKNNIEDVFKSKLMSVETANLKGYELVKEYFVDSSGFGLDYEPALTIDKFRKKLAEDIEEIGSGYTFITNQGQFQLYIGLFIKGEKKSRVIGANTLELLDNDGQVYAVRYHNTNIIEWDHDYIELNSGGWRTCTTKRKINQFLPNKVRLYQKNFDWFIKDDRDGTTKEFFDGIKIAN